MRISVNMFLRVLSTQLLILSLGVYVFGQTPPDLSDLSVCMDGDVIAIASDCEDCTTNECSGFMIYKNNEYYDWVNAYETINFAQGKGMMVELIKYNTSYEPNNPSYYQRAIINLKTGEYILDYDAQNIRYIFEDRLFIVNTKSEGKLVDTYGKVVNKSKYDKIGYVDGLGYFNKGMNDVEEIIFDKDETPMLTFNKFNITEGIDTTSFIAQPSYDTVEDLIDGFYIIDRDENTLFHDEYGYISLMEDSLGNTNVIGLGLDGTDDSYSLLVKDKKGKWYNPMSDFLENHYIDYIASICGDNFICDEPIYHNKKQVLCYATGFGFDDDLQRGYILDTKGRVVVELEGAPRFYFVDFNQQHDASLYPFIFVFTEYSSESFMVYDEDGTILLGHPDNYENFVPQKITKAGYYSFINETENKTYLFNSKTKQMAILKGSVEFNSLKDVQKHF